MFSALASIAGPVLGGLISADAAGDAADAQGQAAASATGEERRQYNINRRDTAPYRELGSDAVGKLSDLLGFGKVVSADPRYKAIRDRIYNEVDASHQRMYGIPLESSGDPSLPGSLADIDRRAKAEFDALYPGASNETGSGELNKKFTVADFWADPVTSLGYESGLKEGTTGLDRAFGARGMLKSGAAVKALTRFGQDYAGQKAGDSYNRFYGDQDRTFNRLSGVAGTGQTAATNTAAMGNATAGRVSDIMTSAGNARGAASIAKGNAFSGGLNTVSNWWNQNQMLDKVLRRPGVGGEPMYGLS